MYLLQWWRMRNQGTDRCVFDEASSLLKRWLHVLYLVVKQIDPLLTMSVAPSDQGYPLYELTQPSLALLVDPISYWNIYI